DDLAHDRGARAARRRGTDGRRRWSVAVPRSAAPSARGHGQRQAGLRLHGGQMSGPRLGRLVTRLRRGAALLLALSACEPVISRSSALEGKACRAAEPACLPGYSCQAGLCVAGGPPGAETAAGGSASRLDSNVEVPLIDESDRNGGRGGAPSTD